MKWILFIILLCSHSALAQTAQEVRRIMNPNSTYYQILDVSPDATDDEIKAAYRKLRGPYHPDRYQSDPVKKEAADKVMRRITEAKTKLLNPDLRRAYDAKIKVATRSAGSKKWQPQDFKAAKPAPPAAKPAASTTTAGAGAKATASASNGASAQAAQTAQQTAKTSSAQSAQSSSSQTTADTGATSTEPQQTRRGFTEKVRTPPNPPSTQNVSPEARAATKFYEDTARCGGEGFFKRFVDVMM